ncbi:hypothetical protein BCV63_11090 [Cylindrospermopsis raciborskii CS-508]|uniref:hypothetical protein n=1 Tax=Cylindrospermopsis raciborskii TaxID=77022 RepID=UPI0008DEA8E9|nr:hypothetical protein [Cylindrospermopsis raciborskii]OHY41062.1 hypothetical protein BCV63_11090 [Cylindrospermopsis raciborskii CS-508]
MKTVVIVAPHFPPSNLTAGHRCRYFATHLPKFGWNVKVISIQPQYYEEKLEPQLTELLPPELEVIRTTALPTRPLRLIGDVGIRAFWWHYQALCKLIESGTINPKTDLIYIPIPSNYSSLLGYLIYKRYGIAYGIDYIDPWVNTWPGCEVWLSKAWFSYNLGKILEPIALRHVRIITAVAPGYYEGVLKSYPWINPDCCFAMPYGVEPEDFKYIESHPRATYLFDPLDGDYHIIYAGAMLPKAYSTLEALFTAINQIKSVNPQLGKRLKFHFVGTGQNPTDPESYSIKPYAEKYQLLDTVTEHPARIPYLDVLNHLQQAQGVLIVGSPERHYTPSKVFQSVLSRRPVIALLHSESTAVSILNQVNTGYLVTFDERKPAHVCIDDMATAIEKAVTNPDNTEQINWDAFYTYSTVAMTEKLAQAFDLTLSANVR